MLLALVIACADSDPGFDPGGIRNDKDDVAGSPNGNGDTVDTGDTAGDTAAGDTAEAICGASDLEFSVVVEDSAGTVATAFSYPVDVTTRAVFTNPCNGRLQFTTATSCVVDQWTLTDGTGADVTFSGNCVDAATTWTLEALEGTSVTAGWGILERSTYTIAARSDAVGRTATEFFSIQ
ncbi:hypothetical protein LBMAG42_09800 [Deltaproteobacteria bacterium]|nr:hypothetical protein LBMAG42_09800 [Deltaproteobacteria bacterium]